jgi:replicative DNA helicase
MMEEMVGDLVANDIPVVVFEKDMSPRKFIERIACRTARVAYWKLFRGILKKDEITLLNDVLESLRDVPLFLYNPVGLTADKLCSIMRREKRIHGVKAGFLDHIQALKVGDEMRIGLTQASLELRRCITETDIPFVAIAHLNRHGGQDSRPSANDIKEFDQLFGDVDAMAMLWSEQKPEDVPPGEMQEVKFYTPKNRDGAVSEQSLLFDGQYLRFLPMTKKQP